MDKSEIHFQLKKLELELRTTSDSTTHWDNDINESIGKLRKHMTHTSGSPCSCCGGSGVS